MLPLYKQVSIIIHVNCVHTICTHTLQHCTLYACKYSHTHTHTHTHTLIGGSTSEGWQKCTVQRQIGRLYLLVVANTHLTVGTWSLLEIQISSLAIANPVSTALELLCSTNDFVNQTNVINITIRYGTATKAEMRRQSHLQNRVITHLRPC